MTVTDDLLTRRVTAIPRGVATPYKMFIERAANAEIWDVEGAHVIDFAGGIAALNTGHRHPHVIAAVKAQLDAFTHTAFQVTPYESYIRLAERLNALAPISGPVKTLLLTTGAEATENAVKIAKAATGRTGVIAFAGAFHGRTMLTMAMTGKINPYKRKFGVSAGAVFHAPFPVAHYDISVEDSLRAIETIFRADIEPADVAAIIIEPVQGEGGFHAAPRALMEALRAICTAHGIVLIVDEIQSGFGRTGRMFAIEHMGVEPDLITVAKSMSGGFPLSAVIGRAELMDAAEPGSLGGTFAGNPVSCAAALAVLDVLKSEDLLPRADVIGAHIQQRLTKAAARNDAVPIGALRGLGAMIAFDVVTDNGGHEPDAAAAKRVVDAALANGLLLLSCGLYGNTIRILVPLTVEWDVLEAGLERLEIALQRARWN